ncbi:MAG: CoA-binding protein [Frankiales bacterium]|nr:CoA-binding protein [Frankiales bacterium]
MQRVASGTAGAARDLGAIFDPVSVAVVGASDDTAKWGHHIARQLLSSPSGRDLHLVNRRGGTVLGIPAARSLLEVGRAVDLVAVCVPADGFLDAVDSALAAGARAIVAVTAGLGEASPEGAAIEAEAVRRTRAAGAVLVGPNCLGVADTSTGLLLSSDPVRRGPITVLSQSGNLVIDLDDRLALQGLGIARFVSLGNQADVTLAELMRSCVDHDATRAVAVYAEDLVDGRDLVAAARDLADAGKPVVLLAPGRTRAAARGAASHTGALTSPSSVVDAACLAGGVHRVDAPERMVTLLASLVSPRRTSGRRVAVLTDGGGHGSVAADVAADAGLVVPELSVALGDRLRAATWPGATTSNPVDLAGAGEQDPDSYARGLEVLLGSDEVDGVLWVGYFGGYADQPGVLGPLELDAARRAAEVVAAQDAPVVVQTIFPRSASFDALHGVGVPVFRGLEEAARSLAAVCGPPAAPRDDLTVPPAAAPVAGTDYLATRDLLQASGLRFPDAAVVRDASELEQVLATDRPAYPVVLKAMGLVHKSDSGGVVIGLRDERAVRSAHAELVARLAPPSVTVEAMADVAAGVEVIAGVRWDDRFGPVLMVGLGGVHAEVLGDVAFALAPASPGTVEALLRGLRGAALLDGVRGRAAVDVAALADAVSRISEVAAAHPELGELEVNPLLATPDGVLALDARAVAAP